MKARWWMAWLLAGASVLVQVAGNAAAQQDEGPILRPKKPLRQIDSASILILDPHGCILSSKKLSSGTSEEYKIDVQ
jgi:hypothetical protein